MSLPRSFALLLVAALAASGCSKKSATAPTGGGTTPQQEVDAGNSALANGDVAGANSHYKAALALSPTNSQANLGAGVTEIYLVQNDPDVIAILNALGNPSLPAPDLRSKRASFLARMGLSSRRRYDPVSNARMMFRAFLTLVHEPPLVSEVQTVLKSAVLPRLQYAEDRLNVIENNPNFVWVVPDSLTGFYGPVEVDLGDVRILDAVINNIQGTVGLLVAYDFDVPSYDHVRGDSLLASGTAFGQLHSDGATQLSAARTNLITATNEVDAAVTSILAETDDQSDDLIPIDALGTASDVSALRAQLDQIRSTLNGPTAFDFVNRLGSPDQVTAYVGRFFTNPLADIKNYLPAHDFDPTTHDPFLLDPITFPDPTFNGIFPGMTNARWQELIGPVAFAAR